MTSSRDKGKGRSAYRETLDATSSSDFLAFGDISDGADDERQHKRFKGKGGRPLPPRPAPVQKHPSDKKTPWAEFVRWDDCTNVAEMLHYEVLACGDWLSALPEEHEIRRLVVEQIRRVVVHEFPGAVVTPFGSYGTNLYLPTGDLDLVVTLETLADVQTILKYIGKALKRDGVAMNITVVGKAKVPIVKFTSVIGEFQVDISLNQTNGISAAQTINGFLTHYPALRYLIMVIKTFVVQRSINEVFTGGLGSYSIICLVLSFLQMHPKIRNGEIDPMENLGVLLMEFFELYGHHFNYTEVGISLHDGGCYYSKADRGWKRPDKPFLLSIEDPQSASNDVSGGSFGIRHVQRTFAAAYETISTAMLQRAVEIEARIAGTYASLRGDVDPESRSMLGCIIGVSQEVLDKRHAIMNLYQTGLLQNMLGEPLLAPPIQVDPADDVNGGPPPSVPTGVAQHLDGLSESKGVADQARKRARSESVDEQPKPKRKRKPKRPRAERRAANAAAATTAPIPRDSSFRTKKDDYDEDEVEVDEDDDDGDDEDGDPLPPSTNSRSKPQSRSSSKPASRSESRAASTSAKTSYWQAKAGTVDEVWEDLREVDELADDD